MINVNEELFKITKDKRVYDDNFDLIDNGVLDSYTFISLFSLFEDNNLEIYPTRINRESLRSPGSIKLLIDEYKSK